MKKLRALVLSTLVIGVPQWAASQGVQTGSLSGAVFDNDGDALPGVAITVSSPTLQGSRKAVSDAGGGFRFPSLPPGGQYTLTLELSGFTTEERRGIPVRVGNSTQIEAVLSPSEFGEVIEVMAERVVVDTTKSTVDYTVDFDELDKLGERGYVTVMAMAPGVQRANNPSVQGNSLSTNLYLVDGVNTTDPRTQTWTKLVNFDTIQEVQVQTAGHEAEYGRAPGGIVNLVTKSGGNEFHGTFRWVETRTEWGSEWQEGKSGAGRYDESRPILTVGGPIVRDKLWFFVGYQRRDNSRDFSWYATPEDKADDILSTGRTFFQGHYFNAKLTWQATPNHMFAAFYNEDPIELGPSRGWGGQNYSADTDTIQIQGGSFGSLQWTGVFTDKFFMSTKLQLNRGKLNGDPISPTWGSAPYIYDYVWDYYYGAPSGQYVSHRDRDGLVVDGTYFFGAGRSSHELKAGVEIQRSKPEIGYNRNEFGSYRSWDGAPYLRWLRIDQLGPATNDQDVNGIYAQDEWRMGKLTLNFGLRLESTTIYDNMGQTVVAFDLDDMVAPRLGFAYDLNGDSINGSLGRFYYEATNYLGSYFNVSDERLQRWDWAYLCEVEPDNSWDYPDECWDQIYDIPAGAGGFRLDPKLRPAHQDVLTLGYRHRINNVMAAGVTFVYRTQDDQIDVYDPSFSGDYYITNVPVASDWDHSVKFMEYSAMILDFEKRFSADRISILANYSYTFSQNSWSTHNDWRDANGWIFTSPDAMNELWWGRAESPHLFKFYGSYVAPWKMVFGINFVYTSGEVGTPWEPGAYSAVPVARRGSYEYGSYNWTDLYVEQPFSFKRIVIALYANVYRLFNQQPVLTRDMNTASPNYTNPTSWQMPRQYQFGFKLEF